MAKLAAALRAEAEARGELPPSDRTEPVVTFNPNRRRVQSQSADGEAQPGPGNGAAPRRDVFPWVFPRPDDAVVDPTLDDRIAADASTAVRRRIVPIAAFVVGSMVGGAAMWFALAYMPTLPAATQLRQPPPLVAATPSSFDSAAGGSAPVTEVTAAQPTEPTGAGPADTLPAVAPAASVSSAEPAAAALQTSQDDDPPVWATPEATPPRVTARRPNYRSARRFGPAPDSSQRKDLR